MPDPFWTPHRVRAVLEYLPELLVYTKPKRDPLTPPAPPARFRLERDPHEFETARVLADVELGFRRLARVDRRAALLLLRTFTGEPDWLRLPTTQRVALLAAEDGVSLGEMWGRVDAARRLLYRAIVGELEEAECPR